MAKNLVIVESPAKGKTVEKFLWSDYKVVASMGHIRDLPATTIWVDIEDGFKPKYQVSKDKKKTVDNLQALAKNAETVWIATDEDREWEAIGWHLCHALKLDPKTTNRIVFHEITKTAITKSIKEPRTIDLNLVDAQQARRVLDRLVWYKVSPILWKKIRKGLSAWRVQSVAVKLIVEKEEEIKAFKPEESWKVFVELKKGKTKIKAELKKVWGKAKKIKSEEEVMKILADLISDVKTSTNKNGYKELESKTDKEFELVDIIKKNSKRKSAPPFVTSTLQQEASRKFGYALKQTMMIAQKLYEWVDLWNGSREGLITYMRTDSTNLSKEAKTACYKVIEELYGKEYATWGTDYKTKSEGAQEAHEAIRPVNIGRHPSSLAGILSPQELKVYDLIWKRTVASQMKDALVEVTTFDFSPTGIDQTWQTKGEVIKFEWFMKVYTESVDDDDATEELEWILPDIEKGEILPSTKINMNQTFSRPPARYTEASLVKKLESEGIWRPSTYAPTISTIMDRGYVDKIDKKYLHPTDIAFSVTTFLNEYFNQMMDYKFTSKVEANFDKIASWDETYEKMLWGFYEGFEDLIKNADDTAEKIVEKVWKDCPECKSDLVYKFSKAGKFIGCSNYPECKYIDKVEEDKKQIEELEARFKDKKCEKCASSMWVKVWRYWPFLACTNYPDCKTIESIKDEKVEVLEEILAEKWMLVDEETGEEMVVKNSRRWPFLAAKNYPKVKIAKQIPKDIWTEVNKRMNPESE